MVNPPAAVAGRILPAAVDPNRVLTLDCEARG